MNNKRHWQYSRCPYTTADIGKLLMDVYSLLQNVEALVEKLHPAEPAPPTVPEEKGPWIILRVGEDDDEEYPDDPRYFCGFRVDVKGKTPLYNTGAFESTVWRFENKTEAELMFGELVRDHHRQSTLAFYVVPLSQVKK